MRSWKGQLGAVFALVLGQGCGSQGDTEPVRPGTPRGMCEVARKVGGFSIALREGFTAVQGKIDDAVSPIRVSEVVASSGACTLRVPPTLFCDPPCGAGTTCDASSTCVDAPAGISVGTVDVSGLTSPVIMTASPPVFFYTNLGTLEHPAFSEGDDIVLSAAGDGPITPFRMWGVGIAPLNASRESISLESGSAVSVSWVPPQFIDASPVNIILNIAQHGGNPGWIDCIAADTGQFKIPVELTDMLLARGFSGFPSLTLARRSVDSATTQVGCIELVVESSIAASITIPGLTSCDDSDDCPAGQTCQNDLTCG